MDVMRCARFGWLLGWWCLVLVMLGLCACSERQRVSGMYDAHYRREVKISEFFLLPREVPNGVIEIGLPGGMVHIKLKIEVTSVGDLWMANILPGSTVTAEFIPEEISGGTITALKSYNNYEFRMKIESDKLQVESMTISFENGRLEETRRTAFVVGQSIATLNLAGIPTPDIDIKDTPVQITWPLAE